MIQLAEHEVFTALFRKPLVRINRVRLVSFDSDKRIQEAEREKRRAYHRGWYLRNRAKVIAKVNAWNEAHPDVVRARKARWQERNIERHRKSNREYARRKRANAKTAS